MRCVVFFVFVLCLICWEEVCDSAKPPPSFHGGSRSLIRKSTSGKGKGKGHRNRGAPARPSPSFRGSRSSLQPTHKANIPEKFGVHADLAVALPLVIINMSNYSGLIEGRTTASPGIAHVFGNVDKDKALLYEMVEGYLAVLHESLPAGVGEQYCPFNNMSVIKRCIDMAACLLQKDVGSHGFTLQTYTLYEETLARFDAITWQLIESQLLSASTKDNIFFQVPEDYECDGSYDDDESALFNDALSVEANGNLMEAEASNSKTQRTTTRALKQALGLSAALESAARATHAILDSHNMNSSADATVAKLHRTWKSACGLLRCDHTNYFDLFGASHSHSLALMEAGVSAHHMRAQIRSRVKLESRLQRFLGEHGEHLGTKIYRAEGTNVEQQMTNYLSRGRSSMRTYVLVYAASLSDKRKLLRLVNWNRWEAFLLNQGKARRGQVAANRSPNTHPIDDVADNGKKLTLTQAMEAEGNKQTFHLGSADTLLASRRLRRRRRFFGGRRRRSFVSVVKRAADVVKDVADFIASTFDCFGQARTMVAMGYCKKFPAPTSTVGVGVAFYSSAESSFTGFLKGNVEHSLNLGLSAVIGAVPGSPVTGGVRTGVGVGGKVSCTAKTCEVEIAVGSVASALYPVQTCSAGPWLAGFKCMAAAGATVSAMCCGLDLIDGSNNCR